MDMGTPPAILSGKTREHARTVSHHNFKVDKNIESKASVSDDNQPCYQQDITSHEGRDELEDLNDRIQESPGFFDVDVIST